MQTCIPSYMYTHTQTYLYTRYIHMDIFTYINIHLSSLYTLRCTYKHPQGICTYILFVINMIMPTFRHTRCMHVHTHVFTDCITYIQEYGHTNRYMHTHEFPYEVVHPHSPLHLCKCLLYIYWFNTETHIDMFLCIWTPIGSHIHITIYSYSLPLTSAHTNPGIHIHRPLNLHLYSYT